MSFSHDAAMFVAGLMFGGYAIAAGFFLRYWISTRDRFFGIFSAAFWLLAANQAAAAFTRSARGEDPLAYLLRLAAFILVILAVLDKNLSPAPGERRDPKKKRDPVVWR